MVKISEKPVTSKISRIISLAWVTFMVPCLFMAFWADSSTASPADYGFSYVDVSSFDASMGVTTHGMLYGWSMREYRSAVEEHRAEAPEQWDELEKSITARLADEVKIFIRGNAVEMVIEKAF